MNLHSHCQRDLKRQKVKEEKNYFKKEIRNNNEEKKIFAGHTGMLHRMKLPVATPVYTIYYMAVSQFITMVTFDI